jgi:hypothetical protein
MHAGGAALQQQWQVLRVKGRGMQRWIVGDGSARARGEVDLGEKTP